MARPINHNDRSTSMNYVYAVMALVSAILVWIGIFVAYIMISQLIEYIIKANKKP